MILSIVLPPGLQVQWESMSQLRDRITTFNNLPDE